MGANAMKSTTTAIVFVLAVALVRYPVVPAAAQQTSHAGDIPQSLRLEHENTLQQLNAFARRHGPVGAEAQKALSLFKQHIKREEDYILPPLTLLPALADGKITTDMKWAIEMADRVKADREEIFREHTQITDAMNRLAAAAERAKDTAALDFARGAVADSLNDIELVEPTAIVISEYLRARLPP
jgi:hypothetical protein